MAKKQQIIKDVLVLFYFSVSTIIISYPLIFHLHDYIFGIGDELLITWIMNWVIYAIVHSPFSLFNANIFYPYHNSLAFSDSFLTSSLIGFFPVLLTQYPLLAYNINYLFAHITLGFFMYLLVRYISGNRFAAIVAGTLATFTTYTVNKYVHLQLLSVQWIPLSMLFFFIYVKKKKTRYMVLSIAIFVLQAANSFLPGFFLIAFYSIAIVFLLWKDKKKLSLFLNRKIIISCFFACLAVRVIALPYFQVSHELNYVRDIRDTIRFANRPEYILYPNDRTRLQIFFLETFYKYDTNPIKHDGYIGLTILVGGAFAILYRLFRGKKPLHQYFDIFFCTAIVSYILSLGPALQWFGRVIKLPFIIPLPYAVLYYVVPGFKGFRNSARWEMLYVLSLSIMIGLLLAFMFKRRSHGFQILVTFCLCLAVLAEVNFPFKYVSLPTPSNFPPVYSYLNSLPSKSIIIELPIYNWSMLPYAFQENIRMYYSTLHHKRMVNGTSGFSPPEWQEEIVSIHNNFPDRKTLGYLKGIGVTHVIVHADEFGLLDKEVGKGKDKKYDWITLKKRLDSESSLRFVKRIQNDYIYQITYD